MALQYNLYRLEIFDSCQSLSDLYEPREIGLGKVKILIPKSAKNMETWCPLRSHSDGINAAL